MAQRVHIVLTDDLDQSDAAETVTFGLDGSTYEIDLSEANAAALREALARYIAKGRRTSGGRAKAARRRSGGSDSATEVRAWARAQGMTVSERGRVSAEVRAAYEEAHR